MIILIIILLIPFFVGATVFIFSQKTKKTGVLLFHRISKGFPKSLSQVGIKQFENFCKEIKKSGKDVCIAFDDGHQSVFDLAFPILKKYNFTAMVFVITGKEISDFYNTKNMMNAENIKEMSDNGFEIGSHTVGHLDLTLLDETDLRNELLNSKTYLEDITRKTISALSFPYGSWNEKVVKIAEECGYKKFIVYRGHKFADGNKIIPATAIYPFDNFDKISGEMKGITKALSDIVPHFAKGTPIFFWNRLYNGKNVKLM